jgi:hypothetical protein
VRVHTFEVDVFHDYENGEQLTGVVSLAGATVWATTDLAGIFELDAKFPLEESEERAVLQQFAGRLREVLGAANDGS